jgi:hypothetical protein
VVLGHLDHLSLRQIIRRNEATMAYMDSIELDVHALVNIEVALN